MRNSTLKPNDFTFTSLLSACTGSGALGQGRSAHCQIIEMGFVSYLHIENALVSMYCKCGNVEDAFHIFENMVGKDIVSWNSMIVGYAQHGLAVQGIGLFERMKSQGVKPDAITFLGVLSSCRHAGFVEGGRNFFNSMVEYGVKPQHSWSLHGSVWIGIQAAENMLLLEPECAATHLQLANLYACVGFWDQAARVRKLMKDRRLKTNPGCSWIEIKNEVYRFRAEDCSNNRVSEIHIVLDWLADHMITLGRSPEMQEVSEVIHDNVCP
ncbi:PENTATRICOPEPTIDE REPEAT-CONTAINING PROTEIN [Salix purpurea]|uniref:PENTATRICOPEPTIDE REPEAT-CONTAINING PROTEIN n=1 Tax=Salix purpurea TaxID=77065 RepID=A0A9Q0VWJ8_SALPP|nr:PENTATRICOPEPTIDE REPEAT-CONTAINING PROTEIN [Salix purpurea]